jgi:hypothetical protein
MAVYMERNVDTPSSLIYSSRPNVVKNHCILSRNIAIIERVT